MLKKLAGSPAHDYINDFRCAFDLGLKLDCLLAYADAAVRSRTDIDQASFAIRKYLEQDPYSAIAWNIQGAVRSIF